MTRTTVSLIALAVLATAGCGFTPDAPAPEAAVQIAGGAVSAPRPAPADAEDPYALMGPVVKDGAGLDRSAWPQQRLQMGRPIVPRVLAPLQNPDECATADDPDRYWTRRDIVPGFVSSARFVCDFFLLPVTAWEDRDAPTPPVEPSPYGVK